MSAWPTYSSAHSRAVEKKKASKSTAYQAKPYYGIVIGAECLQPASIIPQTYKRDDRTGEPLLSKFGNGYWNIDMVNGVDGDDAAPTPDRYICRQWRTPKEVLDTMAGQERSFIGAVKKWLHSNEVSVWFHSGNDDLCSQFGGNHLHVLYKSTQAPNGAYIDPHNTAQYKAIKRSCAAPKKLFRGKRRRREDSDDEGCMDESEDENKPPRFYFKYEGIKCLSKFIQYCHKAPRMFLGASAKDLLQLRKKAIRDMPVDDFQFLSSDIFEADDGLGDSDDEPELKRPRRRGQGDIDSDEEADADHRSQSDEQPKSRKRARVDSLDPEIDERLDDKRRRTVDKNDDEGSTESGNIPSRRDSGFVEGDSNSRTTVTEEFDIKSTGIKYDTKSVRLQALILRIMHFLFAYDKESISHHVGKLDQRKPEHKRLYNCWNRLLAEGANQYCLKAREQLKPLFQHESFLTICERFAKSQRWKDEQYLSVNDSIDLFSDWCAHNGLDWSFFISSTLNVMDKRSVKRNAILLTGPSNGGKSVIFSVPLQTLIPIKCLLSSAGNASQFLWQDVPGTRCVFMEEADITPEHQNTAKKILGGEECAVDVKQQHASTVHRTCVIMTCNSDPFHMVPKQADRVALKNRVFYFRTKTWNDLQHIEEQVNPAMWYKIAKACANANRAVTPEEILNPEDIKEIPMPDEDSIDLQYEIQ